MKLPYKFQMRVPYNEGFTHSVKLNANGDYEVTWARGWAEHVGQIPGKVFDSTAVEVLVKEGSWVIVDDKPKEESLQDRSATLPDEFYFVCSDTPTIYKAKRCEDGFNVTWEWDKKFLQDNPHMCGVEPFSHYSLNTITGELKSDHWKIIDKPTLTAEQQRANKDFREQIQQLEMSIKISQQSEEHQKRMQANYRERIEQLQAKLVEEF